jgi:hypothetical protein
VSSPSVTGFCRFFCSSFSAHNPDGQNRDLLPVFFGIKRGRRLPQDELSDVKDTDEKKTRNPMQQQQKGIFYKTVKELN